VLCAAIGVDSTQQAPFPEIFIVNSTGNGDDAFHGDGQCETAVGNGVCTLRAAIEEANAHAGGDGIGFSIPTTDPGYNPNTGVYTIYVFSTLPDISDAVNINGPGADKLILDGTPGNFGSRVFNVTTAGTVNISGLTISRGFVDPGGGGEGGAGLQNVNSGTVNITSCKLTENEASGSINQTIGGGAIYNVSNGRINVTGSTLQFNRASGVVFGSRGGAIWNKTGTITVSNSTLLGNTSGYYGGAILNEAGVVTVSGSTFYEDAAAIGGAICSLVVL
jgi:hypothetical protein